MWDALSWGVPTGHPRFSTRRRSVGCRGQPDPDTRDEVREFLISRRAKITPAEAGLPIHGERRVPGLRRAEVAALAGVSVEYYSKLERGAIAGASTSVLDSLARALRLDDAERAHLFHLAHAADGTTAGMRPRRRPSKRWQPRPSLQWALDTFTAPAIIRNGRMDLLAANHLGRAMHATVYEATGEPLPNFVRFTFLHLDAAHDFYSRLGPRRRHQRRHPAHRSRPRPPRQRSPRPCRRAVHPQRRLPPPLEQPQRPQPRRRHQTVPPPRRRRPPPRLRKPRHDRRPRTDPHPVRGRAGLTYRPRPRSACLLDQPHRHTLTDRHAVKLRSRCWGVPAVRPSAGCSSPVERLLASPPCPPHHHGYAAPVSWLCSA